MGLRVRGARPNPAFFSCDILEGLNQRKTPASRPAQGRTQYEPQFSVPLLEHPLHSGQTVQLGHDGKVYNRAYALMQLDGPRATVSYYQDSDETEPIFSETIV